MLKNRNSRKKNKLLIKLFRRHHRGSNVGKSKAVQYFGIPDNVDLIIFHTYQLRKIKIIVIIITIIA